MTFPESQSWYPPPEAIKRPQHQQRRVTLELQTLLSFCLQQGFLWPPTGCVTEDDLDPPASASNARVYSCELSPPDITGPLHFIFVCSLSSCLVEPFTKMQKTQAGGGDGALRRGTRSGSGVSQMFAERCQDSSQS